MYSTWNVWNLLKDNVVRSGVKHDDIWWSSWFMIDVDSKLNRYSNLTIVSFELHIYDLAPRNLQQV